MGAWLFKLWLISNIAMNQTVAISFDYGLLQKTEKIVVKEYEQITIVSNLTETLLNSNLHSCVDSKISENEIEHINSLLKEDYEDLIKSLDLFFPSGRLTWVQHWSNCYRYPSICGDNGLNWDKECSP